MEISIDTSVVRIYATFVQKKFLTIVSSEKLLEKLDESVSCRFWQERVQVMENVATKHGLGSTLRIQCENESCPSHKTNSVFNSSKKSRAFEIYWAPVLGLRAIGGGHSAASKFFSFLGLAPINKNTWADHTKKIEGEAKLFLEKELNRASHGVKEWKFSNGELNCSLEDVNSNKKFVSVTCYLSKSYC